MIVVLKQDSGIFKYHLYPPVGVYQVTMSMAPKPIFRHGVLDQVRTTGTTIHRLPAVRQLTAEEEQYTAKHGPPGMEQW